MPRPATGRNLCNTYLCKGADCSRDTAVEGRTVTAKALDYGEAIAAGAFEKTLARRGPQAEDRVWHLVNGIPEKRLSKPAEIWEEDGGLYFRTRLPRTTLAKDVLRKYEAGQIRRHSAGYEATRRGRKGIITEARLHFVSTVTKPEMAPKQKRSPKKTSGRCGCSDTVGPIVERLSDRLDRTFSTP